MSDHSCFRLPRSRGEWIVTVIVAGLLAGWAISLPAWLNRRAFPHLPVAAVFAPFPQPWDAVLLSAAALCLAIAALTPDRRLPLGLACGAGVLLALQDQTRWQPWFYQYLLMLALAAAAKSRNSPALPAAWRLFMVATYFWSGVHKLGPGFDHLFERAFVQSLAGKWPDWAVSALGNSVSMVPWTEIGIALALCFRRLRSAGVVAAVGMHLFLLLLIGPAGTGTNAVVWPWNAVMPVLVILLFRRVSACGWESLTAREFRVPGLILGFLVTVPPVLSRFGNWDRYLAFQMYSGTDRRLMIVMDEPAAAALPAEWRKYLQQSAADPALRELRFMEWSLAELRLPLPSDERLLTALGRRCAGLDFVRAGRVFFYTDFAFLLKERGWDMYSPEEMRGMKHIPPLRRK
ncbi:MAG: hypothetical protein V4726_20300 [Verrucomicrobiota bacterium]